MVDAVKIRQCLQRASQGGGVVEAHRRRPHEPLGRGPRLEKARLAEQHRQSSRGLARQGLPILIREVRPEGGGCGDQVPELRQTLDRAIRRIARDQPRVDRADGNASDPVRGEFMLVQGLHGARLVRAHRPTPLQHQCDRSGHERNRPRRRIDSSAFSCGRPGHCTRMIRWFTPSVSW